MARDKFELLKGLNITVTNGGSAQLTGLKRVTREYMDLHNQIVESIWKIKLGLSQRKSEEKALTNQLVQLENLLTECDSEAKLRDLLIKINAIETDLFGFSHAGGVSPYVL